MKTTRCLLTVWTLGLATVAQAQAQAAAAPEAREAAFAAARAVLTSGANPTLTPFAGEVEIRAYFEAAQQARWNRPLDGGDDQEVLLVEPRRGPRSPPPLRLPEPAVERGDTLRQAGRFLLVLRRGWLHSIDTSGGARRLALVDRIEPGGPHWTIYDNMLVRGEHVLVIGLSRSGMLVSVLRLGPDGILTRRGIFLVTAAANYEAAIAGDNLVLYGSTDEVYWSGADAEFAWPSLRSWDQAAAERPEPPVLDEDGEPVPDDGTREAARAAGPLRPLVAPNAVYRPVYPTRAGELHVVSVCPLATLAAAGGPACRSTVFAASIEGGLAHLTASHAYVAVSPGALDDTWGVTCGEIGGSGARPLLYRVPLAGGPPEILTLPGPPLTGDSIAVANGRVHAMVGRIEPTCGRETANRFLYSAPLSAFGRTAGTPGPARPVVPDSGDDTAVYAGSHFLLFSPYRSMTSFDDLTLVPLQPGREAVEFEVPHALMRAVPALGGLILAGDDGEEVLNLSFVSLSGAPRLTSTLRLTGLREGRAGAYLAAMASSAGGTIGLPAAAPEDRDQEEPPVRVAFAGLDRRGRLRSLGTIVGRAPVPRVCQPTCVPWLDEGRAILAGGRIFALTDSIVIEGRPAGGRLVEAGRLDLVTARARSGHELPVPPASGQPE